MDPRHRFFAFEELHREMERFIGEAEGRRRVAGFFWERIWRPRFNLYDSDEEIVILVDLAGMKKEDLDIHCDARTVYLRGEREDPIPSAAKRCHHLEIPLGPFEREIHLPSVVDPARVAVSYEHGWLEIHLPKAERIRVPIEESEAQDG
ncbi:MAG: Hsp20 family protein [Armatimonadetes bacterium]|nr:Hsp20 family protein [Armatimonadota bacterium]NIM24227.1 Hsp20 family protein [Armatimonadota bacterium]NIM68096.1 Hsp20 family protein [Armatimonadota bacterium]NIM76558.1 Hsp20 family protein [Armatimonadota bacterium]NIN06301.1 Hsp20 family protein [Armatimonadota bacterium]